jgi:hypothetical protein
MMNKSALQAELLNVKKRIKLLMNFRNYDDVLGESKTADAADLAKHVARQKELVAQIKQSSSI